MASAHRHHHKPDPNAIRITVTPVLGSPGWHATLWHGRAIVARTGPHETEALAYRSASSMLRYEHRTTGLAVARDHEKSRVLLPVVGRSVVASAAPATFEDELE
jgi:hypothetical protein